jgi:hypothetical protein
MCLNTITVNVTLALLHNKPEAEVYTRAIMLMGPKEEEEF